MSSGTRTDSTTPPGTIDDTWPDGALSRAFQLGLCTFAILALELGLIRWISGQIRLVAYFANIILLAAFLGMGLGVALGRKRPALVHACLPVLALLSAVLCFSRQLHLMQLRFPAWVERVEYWRVHDLDFAPSSEALPQVKRHVEELFARLQSEKGA